LNQRATSPAGSASIPPHPLWKWAKIAAVVLVLALIAGAVAVIVIQRSRCADGVSKEGPRNECVGVTDGSYVFAEELHQAEEKIRIENQWVLDQGKEYVNIAYFEPMTLIDNDVTTYTAVRHGLEGAYLSQRRANRTNEWNGDKPLFRLLLANPGSQARQWKPVVEQIINGTGPTDRIAAVAGLGQSIGGTPDAVKQLSEHSMIMVGSVITADLFSDIDNLARVVPTNTNEVSAIVEHLKADTKRAMLVTDTNKADPFATNLGDLFRNMYPGDGRVLVEPTEEYQSSDAGPSSFSGIAPEICFAKPDVIFFAGRFRDLKRLLDALALRPCPTTRMRIITGDTVVDLSTDEQVRRNLAKNIQLEHLHLADWHAWTGTAQGFFISRSTEYFTEQSGEGYFLSEFPGESRDDGLAILAFDAVGTAMSAVRRNRDFTRLHGQSAVPGASGYVSLDSGDPERKAMSVLTLTAAPGDSTTTVGRQVISCAGTPFLPRKETDPDPPVCPG
jgi:ABC-type branched-subunit amino acid transport system substrate-binding protein